MISRLFRFLILNFVVVRVFSFFICLILILGMMMNSMIIVLSVFVKRLIKDMLNIFKFFCFIFCYCLIGE